MRRLLTSMALLMLSAGCAQRGAPFSNPFIGSDVVPPPGTRTIPPGQAQPYYGPPTQYSPPVVVEPTSQLPATVPGQPPVDDITPIAGDSPRFASVAGESPAPFVASGDEAPIRVPRDQGRVRFEPPLADRGSTVPHQGVTQASHAERSPPQNRLLAPTSSRPENYGPWRPPAAEIPPSRPVAQTARTQSRPTYSAPVGCYSCNEASPVGRPQTVEITELPPPGSRLRRPMPAAVSRVADSGVADASPYSRDAFVSARARSYRDEQVRPASAVASRPSQLLRTVGDSTPRTWARYGYGDSYEWLQGRLEYLRATGQWKLRYIPVDGVTDDYGGSVVIEALPQRGDDLRPGDFVRVRGTLLTDGTSEQTYSPPYRVASLERLAD